MRVQKYQDCLFRISDIDILKHKTDIKKSSNLLFASRNIHYSQNKNVQQCPWKSNAV